MAAARTLQNKARARGENTRANPPARRPPLTGSFADLLALQRTIGNRAVNALLQAKPRIAPDGDACEREADAIAERLSEDPRAAPPHAVHATPSGPLPPLAQAPAVVEDALRSQGRPLDGAIRAEFEAGLGTDLGPVRVHTDARAGRSALALDARAYTLGRHVVFASGEYAPQTPRGRSLLAHEVTHVLQQSRPPAASAPVVCLQRQGKAGPAKKTPYERPEKDRLNLCFVMGAANAGYYKFADWFARAYYGGTHDLVYATSLCDLLQTIQLRLFGSDRKVGQVIIVSHANKKGQMAFPIRDGDTDKWVSPDEIAKLLSRDWLETINVPCRLAAASVGRACDEKTRVMVKGCNLGQNKEAVNALSRLFGGQAVVTAPKVRQEFAAERKTRGRRTPGEIVRWMVANGYLPPEADRWSDDEKEDFVFRLFPPNWTQTGVRGIPADYLIIKGRRVPPSDPRYGEAIEQSTR